MDAVAVVENLIRSDKIKLGMTRQELREILGEPTDWNVGSRKYPKPTVYKYQNNNIEFHFEYPRQGGLFLVYYESGPDHNPHTLLKETMS